MSRSLISDVEGRIHVKHYVWHRNVFRRTCKQQKRVTSTDQIFVILQTRKTLHRQDVVMRKHRRDDHCGLILHTRFWRWTVSTKALDDVVNVTRSRYRRASQYVFRLNAWRRIDLSIVRMSYIIRNFLCIFWVSFWKGVIICNCVEWTRK